MHLLNWCLSSNSSCFLSFCSCRRSYSDRLSISSSGHSENARNSRVSLKPLWCNFQHCTICHFKLQSKTSLLYDVCFFGTVLFDVQLDYLFNVNNTYSVWVLYVTGRDSGNKICSRFFCAYGILRNFTIIELRQYPCFRFIDHLYRSALVRLGIRIFRLVIQSVMN